MRGALKTPALLRRAALAEPQEAAVDGGQAWIFSAPRLGRKDNQDAGLVWERDGELVLAVADGMGGARAGARAAVLAVEALRDALEEDHKPLRERILDAFEEANSRVRRMRTGAGATFLVASVVERRVRLFHAGDTQALIVGQRGTVKALTRSHSPIGYAVAAGVMEHDEALHHPALHLVSNGLGNPQLMVEISAEFPLGGRDTMLLASDGLFDNLYVHELVDEIRVGALAKVAATLQLRASSRMARGESLLLGDAAALAALEVTADEDLDGLPEPSKPDDLTFILFRPGSKGPRS